MARRFLSPPVLPTIAAKAGETTPNPGKSYCLAWSPSENDVVVWDGTVWSIVGNGSRDGLMRGATGWTADTTYYAAPAGVGYGNTAGWYFAALVSFLPTAGIRLLGGSTAGSKGFDWRMMDNAFCWFMADNTGVNSSAPAVADYFVGPDFGQLHLLIISWDVSVMKMRTWTRRAEVGTGVTRTGYTPGINPLQIGQLTGYGSYAPGNSLTVYGWAMGHGVNITNAEALALFDTVRANGAMSGVPGKTDVLVDLTADVRASGGILPSAPVNRAGAGGVFSRAGTPTLAQVTMANGLKTYGLVGFSGASYLQSASPNVLLGASGGFTVIIPAIWYAVPAGASQYQVLAQCQSGGPSWGWFIQTNAASLMFSIYYNGTSLGATYTLTAADIGVPKLIIAEYTGTLARISVGGTQGTDSAAISYTPQTGQTLIVGMWSATRGFEGSMFGISEAGVLSGAEKAALLAQYASTRKFDVPGKTGMHWDFTTGMGAGEPASVPATIAERSGGVALSRVGTGLQVSRRTERTWGYETTPIATGVTGFSPSACLRSTSAMSDIGAGTCWMSVAFILNTLAGAGTQILASNQAAGSAPLFMLYATPASNAYVCGMANAGGGTFYSSGNGALPTNSALGKIILATGYYDGTKLGLWLNRSVSVSAAATITTGAPTTPLYIGGEVQALGREFASGTILGVAAGQGVLSLAEHYAMYDALVADDGALSGVPGKNRHLYQLHNLSGSVPATVTDLGSVPNNLTRIGTPTLAPINHRAFAA